MAGMTKGLAPIVFRYSAVALTIVAILATPRLPAVSATVCPGLITDATLARASSAATVAGISCTAGPSNRCRMRYICGYMAISLYYSPLTLPLTSMRSARLISLRPPCGGGDRWGEPRLPRPPTLPHQGGG